MERRVLQAPGVATPISQYSNAVEVKGVGRLLFIAGQVAMDERGETVGKGDFTAQARQVFKNIGAILSGAGASFENVVQFTTYLVNSRDIEKFWAVRSELFKQSYPKGGYPTNTLLVVDRLAKEEWLIEVEAMAVLE
jgi:enamine deaminase RidA (YjgF/YER057c/UK114 family)